jgi:hypothetical protein
MNTHLQTTTTLLFFAGLVAALYYFPVITMVSIVILFLYAALYAEIKQTEEKIKNGKDTRTTEGDI